MRITFFGTSHGNPEPHRKCSSALIEVGENRYFVDMGTDPIEQLVNRGIPVESVKAVFITHMHGDHTNGLAAFIDLCSRKYKDADPAIFLPGDTEAAKEILIAWVKCNAISNVRPFRFCHVEEGALYDDGVLRVTAYRTKHMDQAYAYLVEAEGKRVLFSGDLYSKVPMEDFPRSVLDEPLDLAICEAAHFDATAYLTVFKAGENLKQLCFNHYSDRYLASVLSVIQALPEIPVYRATDDMQIVL